MYFFQCDQEDWKQTMVVMAYMIIGIAGVMYALLSTGDPTTLLSRLVDVSSALFLFALITEGVAWNMAIALGKIREARDKGRAEGREAMIQALRDAGVSEPDIQRVEARRDARGNSVPS